MVGIDPMEFQCSIKGMKSKWLIAVDEATRLTVGKQLFEFPENTSRNATGREIWEAFDGMWCSTFGDPLVVRHDPDGAMVSKEFGDEMDARAIRDETTSGEAP